MSEQSAYDARLSELASKCQGLAHTLSYNDSKEGPIKHTLHEASHAIDSKLVRIHKKKDGLLMVSSRGKSRFMTLRERVAYWLLGGKTQITL